MIQLKSLAAPLGFVALTLFTSTLALAGNSVQTLINDGGIQWSTARTHGGASLTIVGPDGTSYSERAKSVDGLRFNRFQKDGLYKYEITLEPRIKRTRPEGDHEARMTRRNVDNKISGTFRIVNGRPVDRGVKE